MLSSTIVKKSAGTLLSRRVAQKLTSCTSRAVMARFVANLAAGNTNTIDDSWLTKPINTADLREFSYAAPSYSHDLSGFGQVAPEQEMNDVDDSWRTTPITNTASLFEFSYAAPSWSESLSFVSPESDFTGGVKHGGDEGYEQQQKKKKNQDQPLEDNLMMTSSPESAFGSVALTEFLNDALIRQLRAAHHHDDKLQVLRPYEQLDSLLPKSLQDVFHDTHDPRAMVVTKLTEPFEIVDVNDSWVGLCGYSRNESRHKTLAELLQGPETDKRAIKQCVQSLLEGKKASTTITNYTKSGRKFTNHLTMGPLYDNHQQLTHFVGVLQEVRM